MEYQSYGKMTEPEKMGAYIRERAEDKGYNVKQLAEKVGVGRTTMGLILHGKARLDAEVLKRTAQVLEISPMDILYHGDNVCHMPAEDWRILQLLRAVPLRYKESMVEQLEFVAEILKKD